MASSKIYAGLDFGTTYSGVAWILHKDNGRQDQVEVVRRWPSIFAMDSDRQKVPSEIHYDQDGTITWGNNIPKDAEPLQWFKLLLLNPEDRPSHLQDSYHIRKVEKMVSRMGKSAVQVTGDYLKHLWAHTLKSIEKSKGPSLVKATPIHVVMTVPAIWKDYARGRMEEAAKIAGILDERPLCSQTTLSFISEPEAAAIATLPELENREDLKVGDTFVTCDCGGGTVDIISYTVNQTEPLVVHECVEGDGALCGATFLDKNFRSLLRKKHPGGTREWDSSNFQDVRAMLNQEWEHGIKANFDGSERTWSLDLLRKRERIQLELTTRDVRGVFNPIINNIARLVEDQVYAIKGKTRKDPKFIILVGGFGRCIFIHKSLEDRFLGTTEVLQSDGERPWSAICRGAAIHGVSGRALMASGPREFAKAEFQVSSRIARLCYGWRFYTRFIEGVHLEEDKSWDKYNGYYIASNQMEWIIKRGEEVDAVNAKTFNYHRNYEFFQPGQRVTMTIFTDTDYDPSSRFLPRFGRGGTFEWDLLSFLPNIEATCTIEAHYRYDYTFGVEVSGASMNLSITDSRGRVAVRTLKVKIG